MHGVIRDLRSGVRFLARNPGFTIVAVACMALGIGANTAVFSATYAIVLRQLPYPDAGALIEIRASRLQPTFIDSKFMSVAKTDDLIAQAQSLAAIGRFVPVTVTLSGGTEPEQLSGLMVTPEWFSALGVAPIAGRTIQPQDLIGETAPRIVVISHALWQRSFGGNRSAIGAEMLLSALPSGVMVPFARAGRSYTVIGVMPDRSRFPADGDLWLPLRPEEHVTKMGGPPRATRNIGVVARLRPGQSLSRANSDLHLIATRLGEQYPDTDRGWELRALLLRDAMTERYSTVLLLLLLAVTLILVLTCICISGLLVARNRARQKEVAIRETLGASRSRLIQQFLCEGIVLATIGGALGALLAIWLVGLIRAFAPAAVPRLEDLKVDALVFAYTAIVALLAGIVVGIAPAVQLTTPQLGMAIKDYDSRNRNMGAYRLRLRGLLIGFEIALVFPVAIGAVLMLRTVNNLVAVDVGYRTDHVLTATVKLSATTCAEFAACNAAFADVVDRLRALPGVESVAVSGARPFGSPMILPITTDKVWDQKGQSVQSVFQVVTSDYFRTLGITVRTGRTFSDGDTALSPKVAVVNAAFAKRVFGDKPAIGQSFSLAPANRPGWIEVVGEVADTRDMALTRVPMPTLYVPMAQADLIPRTVLLIRTSGAPMAIASLIPGQVRAIDKNAPITAIDSLDNVRALQVAEPRFQAVLLTVFAALGVALAVIGIYGLISYATSDRVQEFGIRLALGAKPADIFRLVIVESLSTIGWGLTFGIGAAIGLSRLLRGQLYEVSPNDPGTFVAVGVLLVIASLFAYCLPARRATLVDPLVALRHE